MTRSLRLVSLLFSLLILFPTIAVAGDVSGTWKGEMSQGGHVAFTLKGQGDSFTGTWRDANGKDLPIKDGKVK